MHVDSPWKRHPRRSDADRDERLQTANECAAGPCTAAELSRERWNVEVDLEVNVAILGEQPSLLILPAGDPRSFLIARFIHHSTMASVSDSIV